MAGRLELTIFPASRWSHPPSRLSSRSRKSAVPVRQSSRAFLSRHKSSALYLCQRPTTSRLCPCRSRTAARTSSSIIAAFLSKVPGLEDPKEVTDPNAGLFSRTNPKNRSLGVQRCLFRDSIRSIQLGTLASLKFPAKRVGHDEERQVLRV